MTLRITLCILIFLAGCNSQQMVKTSSDNPDIQTISQSMSKMEQKDIEIAYKQFSGLAQYLEYTSAKKVDSTLKLVKIIDDFQSDYGYTRNKYPEYHESVKEFLTKSQTTKPQKIDSSNLNKVIADMKVLADAAKLAMKDK